MSGTGSNVATGSAAAAPVAAAPASSGAPVSPVSGLKICCACPETRKPRDECVVRFGEENCADFIEAHKQCLRSQGFKI